MKKVIFLAIAAAAALTACSKSEVIDSKYNEAITFEHYVGRDAQTKATVADKTTLQTNGFGVYGFYTAGDDYQPTTTANLMNKQVVNYTNNAWVYTPVKYWTNATDKYTFFAYSPVSLAQAEDVAAPSIQYSVDNDLAKQIDVLYSNNNLNIKKQPEVGFTFKHALARITVTASATMYPMTDNGTDNGTDYDNTFHVKEVTLKGAFNTSGTLNLASKIVEETVEETTTKVAKAAWTATPGEGNYNFFTTTDKAVNKGESVNYVSAKATNYGTYKGNNYLMVIPTDFTSTPATLVVKYSLMSAGVESSTMTKELSIAENFEMGKAYSINLAFALDADNQIKFNVTSVEGWSNEVVANIQKPEDIEEANKNNPEEYPDKTPAA